jgi:hypothetical protein
MVAQAVAFAIADRPRRLLNFALESVQAGVGIVRISLTGNRSRASA